MILFYFAPLDGWQNSLGCLEIFHHAKNVGTQCQKLLPNSKKTNNIGLLLVGLFTMFHGASASLAKISKYCFLHYALKHPVYRETLQIKPANVSW